MPNFGATPSNEFDQRRPDFYEEYEKFSIGEDTLSTIYNEIKILQQEITEVGRRLKQLSIDAVRAQAEYDLLKNQELVYLYAEEAGDPEREIKPFKRTEAQREALYRTKFSTKRVQAQIAKEDAKSERDLLNSLQSALTACQTRAKILETEINLLKLK